MKRHYLRGYVQRAGDDSGGDGKPLRIVAATEGRKGDGLNLTMDGARLERFEANPVVGYGHSYWGRDGLPIGRADKTWIDGEKLMMDISFDAADDFAAKVERKYRGGYMSAFSIGFDVWDIGKDGTPGGWELFEVSAVPLPMDPDAVVESGRHDELARLVRSMTRQPDSLLDIPDVLSEADIAKLRQLIDERAGAVLSKKNKQLVTSARDALTELLDAAGDGDDDGRSCTAGVHVDPAHLERLQRLAGITAART